MERKRPEGGTRVPSGVLNSDSIGMVAKGLFSIARNPSCSLFFICVHFYMLHLKFTIKKVNEEKPVCLLPWPRQEMMVIWTWVTASRGRKTGRFENYLGYQTCGT